MIDEPVETDSGSVELVNTRIDDQGVITETRERSESWAWKRGLTDGSVELTTLSGDVRFNDVCFAYEPGETVLHEVSFLC